MLANAPRARQGFRVIVSSLRAHISDRKARRQRDNLITRIGELTFAQRTDPDRWYQSPAGDSPDTCTRSRQAMRSRADRYHSPPSQTIDRVAHSVSTSKRILRQHLRQRVFACSSPKRYSPGPRTNSTAMSGGQPAACISSIARASGDHRSRLYCSLPLKVPDNRLTTEDWGPTGTMADEPTRNPGANSSQMVESSTKTRIIRCSALSR